MARFHCSCFDGIDEEPGFDAEASAVGMISVKVNSDGQFLYVNEEGYDCVDVGDINFSSVTCGSCGEPV